MARQLLREQSGFMNSGATQTTHTLYTTPAQTRAQLTEVVLMTDAPPNSPLRVTLQVGGATQWTRLVNHLHPTVWRNSVSQIEIPVGQAAQLRIEATPSVQTLHCALCVIEQTA